MLFGNYEEGDSLCFVGFCQAALLCASSLQTSELVPVGLGPFQSGAHFWVVLV